MIKQLRSRVNLIWKYMFFYFMIALGLSTVFYVIYYAQHDPSRLPFFFQLDSIESLVLKGWLFSLWFGFVVTLLLYWRSKRLLAEINGILQSQIEERHMDANFEELYTAKSFVNAFKQVGHTLELFKTFEALKTNKTALEFVTLKTLMNNISEAILIVNANKVVTQVNQQCNDLLKLIPGEIVDQSISRKISHPTLLQCLERAIKQDEKITDAEVPFKDKDSLRLNIFPLKNKYGEVVRALIILDENFPKKKGKTT